MHDGELSTSAEVYLGKCRVRGLKGYAEDPPKRSDLLERVTDIETPDARTAIVKHANPVPYMIRAAVSL